MDKAIKLKLHKIKCIDKQEQYKDEIILWGVMVCNNNLFMVTPKIQESSFWEGTVKNFNPPSDLIVIPLANQDFQNNVVIARAAVWIVERDDSIGWLWKNNGNEAYKDFQKLYSQKLNELNITNPGVNNSIEAFKTILPSYHNHIVGFTSGIWIDNDEVFPYINTEFRSNQLPPLHSEVTPVSINIKKAHGGQYELDLSWSLEID